jgi:hypothetical protein
VIQAGEGITPFATTETQHFFWGSCKSVMDKICSSCKLRGFQNQNNNNNNNNKPNIEGVFK